jgi:GT2 family glycosyltransferase/SAM-dependent methyltransferase
MEDGETLNLGQYLCPCCGASDRDRLYALYMKMHLSQKSSKPLRVLEIAPAHGLSEFIKKLPNTTYRSADLYSSLAMDKVDIMDMNIYHDESFDFIICSHVLEHVRDDRLAMSELFRILAPDGKAILMVPIIPHIKKTDEDPDEKDPLQRTIRFGQDDHVRQYGREDFLFRLRGQKFSIEELQKDYFDNLTPHGNAVFKRHGIGDNSVLYIASKSSNFQKNDYASPKLTIAIPAYKPKFFESALKSALAQEFDDFEILICDDCRSDAIKNIVTPYIDHHGKSKIRYIYNEEQLGDVANCQKCLDLSNGTYIKFLFDDDILLPEVLSTQSKILDEFPGVSLVTSRRKIIDENGELLKDNASSLRPFTGDYFIQGSDLVSFFADYTLNFIGEPTSVMFRRAQLLPEKDELFSLDGEVMYWLGDLTMYLKVLRLGYIAMLEKPGACFRISNEQVSHTSRTTPGIGDEIYKKFSEKIKKLAWYRTENNHLVRMAPLDAPFDLEKVDLLSRVRAMLQGQDAATSLTPEPYDFYPSWIAGNQVSAQHSLLSKLQKANAAPAVTVLIATHSPLQHQEKTRASLATQLQAASAIVDVYANAGAPPLWQDMIPGWTLLLSEGDALEPEAIVLLQRVLTPTCAANALIAYFDHDEVDANGKLRAPHLKPAFNPDLLLSYPYMGRALAVRTEWAQPLLEQADGVFDLACAYRLMLQALRDAGPAGFVHVPAVLAHLTPDEPTMFVQTSEAWQRLAQVLDEHLQITAPGTQIQEGPGPGTFHAIYPLERTPLVSIIVPTRDQLPFLSRCIDSLLSNTDYPAFEILIVDNDSQTPEAREFLAGLSALGTDQIRVLSAPGQFNFSRMNNLAVAQARGEFILLLNNDTAALQPEWLGHMVRHALRDGVGIVGARLLYPDGKVQHAGVIMGLRGPAEHPCLGLDNTEPGYLFRAQVTQNFSAVTAACMLVSKAVYEEVGGLDEVTFGVSYNDIDFCLRVGQTGRRIVWTPLATLLHEGSASQKAGIENKSQAQKVQRFGKEQEAMYLRWPAVIANDPAYNPNLSLVERGYEIETNPLLCFDKFQGVVKHRIAAFAADNQGCGNYRMLQPLQAMLNAGLCTGGASPEIFSPNLALRSGADTLIFQRPNSEVMLANLKALTPLKGIKKIYEVDDHLARVPIKSAHYEHMPKDLRGKMLKAIGLCDRLVVSTEPLARELRSYNGDVRVVLNRIPPAMWGAAPPQRASSAARAERRKPKVGWAGGIGHLGDLEMITGVIKDLADTVDWVFFGMCPDSIRPYVREFHTGIPTLEYPHKLMELAQDWDLAIAPLESNPFNDCKSNLKLLEYGWCGVPVVCSDVLPYQCDLPATRVKNRHKNWREAILERVTDLQASCQEGLALQERIASDWMLTGDNLQGWYQAWTD